MHGGRGGGRASNGASISFRRLGDQYLDGEWMSACMLRGPFQPPSQLCLWAEQIVSSLHVRDDVRVIMLIHRLTMRLTPLGPCLASLGLVDCLGFKVWQALALAVEQPERDCHDAEGIDREARDDW